jgi:hypothetical protein
MGGTWPAPPADWIKTVTSKRDENVAKMAPRLMNNNSPMDYHGALDGAERLRRGDADRRAAQLAPLAR